MWSLCWWLCDNGCGRDIFGSGCGQCDGGGVVVVVVMVMNVVAGAM